MERKNYEPTEKQIEKWNKFAAPQMPSDDEFKAQWKKSHHGKETGWGMVKRNWIISSMSQSMDYQMGIWQGRVDAARGIEYAEVDEDKAYNLGYYRGYTNFTSDTRGWDAETRNSFYSKYVEEK